MYIQSGESVIISRDNLKKRLRFLKSLRFRILIILLLIGMVPSVIASFVLVRSYVDRAVSLRSGTVQNQFEILCDTLRSEDYVNNTDNPVIDAELSLLSNVYNGRVLIVDSNYVVVKDTYDLDTGKTSLSREVITCMNGDGGTSLYDSDDHFIEIIRPIMDADNDDRVDGVLVASVSTNEIFQNQRILRNQGFLVTAVVCLLVLVGGLFLSRLLVSPFQRVTRAIEDVTDGYTDTAISVPDYTETEQITDAFNTMLSRVKNVDNSRSDFVSNVSHELKTPMTSMKVLADSLLAQEDVPVELYREFMEDIAHEIDRENRIITDLLNMVRVDKKAGGIHIEETDIGGLIEQILHIIRPLADKKGVSLIFDSDEQVTAQVDELKLSTGLQNLFENAIKYNIDDGWVRIDLKKDRKFFIVNVSDSGIGIPEDQQEHIFERFYRVDKSHSTAIEGTGLGLAITRQVVLLHRGTISIFSRPGEGTTFSVRIPLTYDGGKEAEK